MVWVLLACALLVLATGVTLIVRSRRATTAGHATAQREIAALTDQLRDRDAELDRLRADRQARAAATQDEQRRLNQRLRRRAKEAIDGTAAVIGGKLEDVVVQVGAARDAAAATQERVTVTNDAAETLVRRAHSADEAATALNASLRQVAGIASVISGIASQTRLLALNATIEAVRAGAAGSGFAVVADEVKGLADTTADSTEQITSTIAALESDVAQMAETLSAIIRDVGDIEDAMRQLGGIADQQHGIVMQLHQSVDATMAQIGDLSSVAERLERRRHDRSPVHGTITLTPTAPARSTPLAGTGHHTPLTGTGHGTALTGTGHGTALAGAGRGAPVPGRMIDLSPEGLGCSVPAGIPMAVGDEVRAEFTLDGLHGTAEARVVRRVIRDGAAEIGLEFDNLTDETRNDIDSYLSRRTA